MGNTAKMKLWLATALLSASLPFPALADTIHRITLDLSSNIRAGEEGGDVEVSTDTDGCYVDRVEIMKAPSRPWQGGDEPSIQVILSLDEESLFDSDIWEDEIT